MDAFTIAGKKPVGFIILKMTPALQEILSYYIAKPPKSSFVFPIIRRLTAEQQDRDMIYGRKKYNKHPKRLAGACEIPSELEATMTMKVIRHSFATRARLAGAPIDVIKEMLGHSCVKVTGIYMNSLPSNTLDDFNEIVLKGLKLTKGQKL